MEGICVYAQIESGVFFFQTLYMVEKSLKTTTDALLQTSL
jgi:hypothetical protein